MEDNADKEARRFFDEAMKPGNLPPAARALLFRTTVDDIKRDEIERHIAEQRMNHK